MFKDPSEDHWPDIYARYLRGDSAESIAKTYDVTRERIRQIVCHIIDKANVKPVR